jgi:glycosyltransferase involved in cell wall biosynthesis
MNDRIRILVLSTFYLPGWKGGGPIRSVSGMVEALGDEFDFRILTADRDLGDQQAYPGVPCCAWVPVGKAHVMYLPPDRCRLASLGQLINEIPHDVIYLGGGFDPQFVLRLLLLRWLGLVRHRPVVVAPQGVFSEGAMHIHAFKKRVFVLLARWLKLYHHVTWHVATRFELRDTRRALRLAKDSHIWVVAPRVRTPAAVAAPAAAARQKSPKRLQVVFLSRISPKKNLDGALRILQGVDVPIDFHIYGPAEEPDYWRQCQCEMRELPPHVLATYHGPIPHEEIARVLGRYDLFFLPTLGENFGHVIIEALGAGCPVLISDTTAFRQLESQGAGWDLPLADPEAFRQALRRCAAMSPEEWLGWSAGARSLAARIVDDGAVSNRYRAMFREVVARSDRGREASSAAGVLENGSWRRQAPRCSPTK